MTCTFNAGTFTLTIPGWTTHYANDVVTANASWCQNCGTNFSVRVDPLTNNETLLLVLPGYVSGTARVNWMMVKH